MPTRSGWSSKGPTMNSNVANAIDSGSVSESWRRARRRASSSPLPSASSASASASARTVSRSDNTAMVSTSDSRSSTATSTAVGRPCTVTGKTPDAEGSTPEALERDACARSRSQSDPRHYLSLTPRIIGHPPASRRAPTSPHHRTLKGRPSRLEPARPRAGRRRFGGHRACPCGGTRSAAGRPRPG